MKRILVVLCIVILVLLSIVCDFIFPVEHEGSEFWWSYILGFFLLFGLIGCVILIVVSKLIGHYWLQRKEDYYE